MSSKTLTSGIAAAALIGAIGLAYAQTTTGNAAMDPATTQTTPNNAVPAAPAAMPDAATTPSSTDTTSTAAPAELPAQADRN
jgi:hypothetical protein